MIVFRENTEDIYAGIEWKNGTKEAKKFYEFLKNEMGVNKVRFPETSSFGVKPVSEEGSKRLISSAIKYAIKFNLALAPGIRPISRKCCLSAPSPPTEIISHDSLILSSASVNVLSS